MASLSNRQRQCLQLMGIPVWRAKNAPAVTAGREQSVNDSVVLESPATIQHDKLERWAALKKRVENCTQCSLNQTRTQTVFGVGDKRAQWVFVGEAPGADEDRQGEPFVGRAGQLLTAMLHALGFEREQVYIANILKCRPPNNRDPLPNEVECCEPYLQQQLELINPRIIVALGRVAAQNLLKTDERIGVLRGRRFFYGTLDIPLVVTYHPAYLLRSPKEKRKAWADLCLAKSVMAHQAG